MIISDREIIAALRRPFIRITPEPDPADPDMTPAGTKIPYEPDAPASEWGAPAGIHSLALRARRHQCANLPCRNHIWSSTALGLKWDANLEVWRAWGGPGAQTAIDPSDPEFNATLLAGAHATPVDCSTGFEIDPGMFPPGWTIERIQLPHSSRIAARVEGKSSLARIGIGVHVTAPTIHAGFGYLPNDLFQGRPRIGAVLPGPTRLGRGASRRTPGKIPAVLKPFPILGTSRLGRPSRACIPRRRRPRS
jgi:deoxycytidine triphosphate deaminase